MFLGGVWFPWAVLQPFQECHWCFAESTHHSGFSAVPPVLRGGLDTSVGRFTGMSALCWELCQCLVGDIKQLPGLMTR